MPRSPRDYTVACICPMGVELAPVKAMLDEEHSALPQIQRDLNSYVLGSIAGHNVVIAAMPEIGTNAAASVATQLLNDFEAVRFGLLVGIGGGVPDAEDEDLTDIRLGDVVVSKPTSRSGGVIQYDFGKYLTGSGDLEQTGMLNKPPPLLRGAVEQLAADHRMKGSRVPDYLSQMFEKYPAMLEEYSHQGLANDQLFRAEYPHSGGRTCRNCEDKYLIERHERRNTNPKFHYGTIGSANVVVKDAALRERLRAMNIICLEMEAAGLADTFPCLIIRGICDYADSHKNKRWQPYAAATAAAYMKELLSVIPSRNVNDVARALDALQVSKYARGLNLFDGPEIDDTLFVGRDSELSSISSILTPDNEHSHRKVVALVGIGGVGKTQLAINYAKLHRKTYESIFWINAATELTLKNGFRAVGKRIFSKATATDNDSDGYSHLQVLDWLSESENTRWLIILDNYDDPRQYDISHYFPTVSHGSIIVTTRISDKVLGKQIFLQSFKDLEAGLEVLRTRSGRNITKEDSDALRLVSRLEGFPLALATAGAYLRKSVVSFKEYLDAYEQHWNLDPTRPIQLLEYRDRTFHTTWNLSYALLVKEDEEATKLLKLLAYFDNQGIWYELLHAGINQRSPEWLRRVAASPVTLGNVMAKLIEYCFVDVQPVTGSYCVHACVHDWISTELNKDIDRSCYWYAFDCVAASMKREDWFTLGYPRYATLVPHATRLVHHRFADRKKVGSFKEYRLRPAGWIARLLKEQRQFDSSAKLLAMVLESKEKSLGFEHPRTLDTALGLSRIYRRNPENLPIAEQLGTRALDGLEKKAGPTNSLTLLAIDNLGIIYKRQGKVDEAEQLLLRALAGKEKALGPEDQSTLATIYNLGSFYDEQGKLDQAEQYFVRALEGKRKVFGEGHLTTLETMLNLGLTYHSQGNHAKAEEMCGDCLKGTERILGPDHVATLRAVYNMGLIYAAQGRFSESEQMFAKAYNGREKLLGPGDEKTLKALYELAQVNKSQGKLIEAERLFQRLYNETEKALGASHERTLKALNDLARVCEKQGKQDEAQLLYAQLPSSRRSPTGRGSQVGLEDETSPQALYNLARAYQNQGMLAEAEQQFELLHAERLKTRGPNHQQTLEALLDLGSVQERQNKLQEAEQTYVQAYEASKEALGRNHAVTLRAAWDLFAIYKAQGRHSDAENMFRQAERRAQHTTS